jgi:gliding motility-associated lipoprotein GldH
MILRNLSKFGFIVALLFLVSCDTPKVYDEYQTINSDGWLTTESVDFEIEMDAVEGSGFNYLIGLRNNNDYLYSNIFFFVDVENPAGAHQQDTLQYLLAQPNGKWIGAGVGAIKHNLFKFKQDQSMEAGIYKIKLSHGMRDEVLVGIEDIGFRIERSN